MSTRKRKISSSYCCFFVTEQLFYLFWSAIYFCQNYIKQKFEYIFLFDADKYKKCYFYRRYYDLAFFLAEIDRINIDCKKLDKKILEAKAKIFYFCYQRKLFFRCLRKLGDREA